MEPEAQREPEIYCTSISMGTQHLVGYVGQNHNDRLQENFHKNYTTETSKSQVGREKGHAIGTLTNSNCSPSSFYNGANAHFSLSNFQL